MKKKMSSKLWGIGLLVVLILVEILWLHNQYDKYATDYCHAVDESLQKAAGIELDLRLSSVFRSIIDFKDTTEYITRTITMADTVFTVTGRRDDPTFMPKIRQYIYSKFLPVNINHMDSLFRQEMDKRIKPVKVSHVEYWDLKRHKLISSTTPEGELSGYFESQMDTLDILKTIGVKAYAKAPVVAIFKPVIFQALWAMVLIVSGVLLILWLLKRMVVRPMSPASRRMEKRLDKKTMKKEIASFDSLIEKAYGAKNRSNILREIADNEDGLIGMAFTPVRLLSLFEELKEEFTENAGKTVIFTIDVPEDLTLVTDEMYLYRILGNLLENSVKFSDEPVHITLIALQKGDDRVVIIVRDDGWGIPVIDKHAVFGLGYQVPVHAKRLGSDKGDGLGLHFVESFVCTLSGRIFLNSQENEYTELTLEFPVSDGDAQLIERYHKIGKQK